MEVTPSASAGASDPSSAAMDSVLVEMRKARTNGWVLVSFTVVVAGLLAVMALGIDEDPLVWSFMALVLGGIVVLCIAGWVRNQHERRVMPTIAGAFGLRYQKAPAHFYKDLPQNFIPLGGRRSVDDLMAGTVADRRFRFAECKTETGGKNSRPLFKGVVMVVESKGTLPAFIIASEKETKGFLFFKGRVQVDETPLLHQAAGRDGQTYGLWSHSADAMDMAGLRAFMEQIIALGPKVLGQSTLYSLVSTGGFYYVSLRHNRDLFKIGGLFSDDATVLTDMRTAAAEFAHPIEMVTEILRAEQALLTP